MLFMTIRSPQEWAITDSDIVRPADFDNFNWCCCGYTKRGLLEMLRSGEYSKSREEVA